MKNSIDTIGNRTRDLPACSAVTQLRHRVPRFIYIACTKCRVPLIFYDWVIGSVNIPCSVGGNWRPAFLEGIFISEKLIFSLICCYNLNGAFNNTWEIQSNLTHGFTVRACSAEPFGVEWRSTASHGSGLDSLRSRHLPRVIRAVLL